MDSSSVISRTCASCGDPFQTAGVYYQCPTCDPVGNSLFAGVTIHNAKPLAGTMVSSQALPSDSAARKATPITTGVLDYFPLALAEIARVSKAGNDQHNPGQPLHWSKGKSTDHADCLVRHLLERGTMDSDGMRHTAKVAWRALALLQTELEGPC